MSAARVEGFSAWCRDLVRRNLSFLKELFVHLEVGVSAEELAALGITEDNLASVPAFICASLPTAAEIEQAIKVARVNETTTEACRSLLTWLYGQPRGPVTNRAQLFAEWRSRNDGEYQGQYLSVFRDRQSLTVAASVEGIQQLADAETRFAREQRLVGQESVAIDHDGRVTTTDRFVRGPFSVGIRTTGRHMLAASLPLARIASSRCA